MTAATGRVGVGVKPFGSQEAPIPGGLVRPLAAAAAPFRNWLMGVDANGRLASQAAAVTDLISGGFSDQDNDGHATAGRATNLVRQQFVSGYPNSTVSLDAILDSDYCVPCWAVDNQTVGKKSNNAGVNRSLLGLAFGLDPDNNTPIIYPGPLGWQLARVSLSHDAYIAGSWTFSDAAANTATAERTMKGTPVHGKVTAINFNGAAVAADNTDFDTVTVSKRDGAGGGAVVVATYDSRVANQGAITAFVDMPFALSAVAGALNLLETDVLTVTATKSGAGKVLTGELNVYTKVG